jgi:nucleoside-diphosphate-sugar epimerase
VIKLLPPLTLSESEAQRFLRSFDTVLRECDGAASRHYAVVRDIAVATMRRRLDEPAARVRARLRARGTRRESEPPEPHTAPVRPDAPERTDAPERPTAHARRTADGERCLVTGASGFIGGRLVQRLVEDGYAVRCLVRASSDTSALSRLPVEISVGRLENAESLAPAIEGCGYVFHCGALVSDWATRREIVATNVVGTRSLLSACADASVKRFVHFSTTDVYGHPNAGAVEESHEATRFCNWYAQSKLEAEREVRQAGRARGLESVILRPATVYGPGSASLVGEIARAMRTRSMLLIDGGRSIAGLCYVDNLLDAALLALHHEAARGEAFNVSDGLQVTWREFTDSLAKGLGCARTRLSMPYWLASGVGFSLEHGYRALRATTGLRTRPLLSRQAVHVLGRCQDFSARHARETLGWEPRVDYAGGIDATVAWLRTDYLAT